MEASEEKFKRMSNTDKDKFIKEQFERLKTASIQMFKTISESEGDSQFDSFKKNINSIKISSRGGRNTTRRKYRKLKKQL